MPLIRIAAAMMITLAAAATAAAQPVLITAPATVGPLDTTITPTAGGPPVNLATAEITIEGTTLTMNGRHGIASLAIVRNGLNQSGVLTHAQGFAFDYSGAGTDIVSGLDLTVSGDLLVQGVDGLLLESRIDLSGRGFLSDLGPGAGTAGSEGGGGSHGGAGSRSSNNIAGGSVYGSFTSPVAFGSAGGRDTSHSNSGGPGGGALKLRVHGSLTLGGAISANGLVGAITGDAGGGAGGSIWIDADFISGAGLISASGGPGHSTGGAGGGGRIAVYADASTIDDSQVRAYGGGVALNVGAAGTVYHRLGASAPETLVIDNGDLPFGEAITEMSGTVIVDADMVIRNNGRVGPPRSDDTLALSVLGDLHITPSGYLFSDGRGYTSDLGPGAGTAGSEGGGGSHGGAGARSSNGTGAGAVYGSFTNPTTLGSAGGRDASYSNSGGPGGGVIRLSVLGALTVDGAISSNGLINTLGSPSADGGGGAGGSIWIDAASLDGAGLITANGGPGRSTGGAGAGGRVAVYTDASTFDDARIRAYGGGTTINVGAAGTVYRRLSASAPETLVIDNGDLPFFEAISEMSGDVFVDGDMLIRNNGRVGPPRSDDTLALSVLGDMHIADSGHLTSDGRGFTSDLGPGAGTAGTEGGGGSHGGAGSRSGNGTGAGTVYGSFVAPNTMGSAGGRDASYSNSGGPGGGVIRLSVLGALTVDGAISSNGLINTAGSASADGGGGAGGSVWIDAAALDGTGLISASGGPGRSTGGAGGGGRVAIYADTSAFDDASIRAYGGGTTINVGAAGTVHRRLFASTPETLVIDNGGLPFVEAITEMAGDVLVDGDMLIRNNGRVGPPRANDTLALTILGDMLIADTGHFTAEGRGFTSDLGPGAGAAGSEGGGGGHGGRGANSANGTAGGLPYGSAEVPITMGSAGGRDASYSSSGGPGGGALALNVLGTLTVNGTISANGLINTTGSVSADGGGGAGGSVLLSAGSIGGLGAITANGGPGRSTGGSGAGGRIAIYACAFELMTEQVVASGNVGTRPGEDGTVYFGALAIGPGDIRACLGSTVTISVVAQAGGASNGYQWQLGGVDLVDGPTPQGSIISGSSTDTLQITGVNPFDSGAYTCVSDGLCGTGESNTVEVSICPSDYNCDGITDILDFLDFFGDFGVCTNEPAPCGTLGSPDITGDGFIDILDFLDFLQYFGDGC